jgi:hypothetical protein
MSRGVAAPHGKAAAVSDIDPVAVALDDELQLSLLQRAFEFFAQASAWLDRFDIGSESI